MSSNPKDATVIGEVNDASLRRAPFRAHGGGLRGEDLPRKSDLFEGCFGRMFRTLPPAQFDEASLKALAEKMTADADTPTPDTEQDDEENSGIAAGYTYLASLSITI